MKEVWIIYEIWQDEFYEDDRDCGQYRSVHSVTDSEQSAKNFCDKHNGSKRPFYGYFYEYEKFEIVHY